MTGNRIFRCKICGEITETFDPCCGVGPQDPDAVYERVKEEG